MPQKVNKLSVEFVEDRSCPEPNTGCWLVYPNRHDGYTVWSFAKNQILAHRASWIAHFGQIPEGLFVCHRCDTPACVNPGHLFLGTHTDNMDDMVSKGRQPKTRTFGEDNGRSKLNPEQVNKIREMRGSLRQREIAKMFGVTQAMVSKIQLGQFWK